MRREWIAEKVRPRPVAHNKPACDIQAAPPPLLFYAWGRRGTVATTSTRESIAVRKKHTNYEKSGGDDGIEICCASSTMGRFRVKNLADVVYEVAIIRIFPAATIRRGDLTRLAGRCREVVMLLHRVETPY